MVKAEHRLMTRDLYRRGVSISDIARVTGHDRKRIRTILQGPMGPTPRKRKARAKQLQPFVPYLERHMEEGVLNGNKLLAEIRIQSVMALTGERVSNSTRTRRTASPDNPWSLGRRSLALARRDATMLASYSMGGRGCSAARTNQGLTCWVKLGSTQR